MAEAELCPALQKILAGTLPLVGLGVIRPVESQMLNAEQNKPP